MYKNNICYLDASETSGRSPCWGFKCFWVPYSCLPFCLAIIDTRIIWFTGTFVGNCMNWATLAVLFLRVHSESDMPAKSKKEKKKTAMYCSIWGGISLTHKKCSVHGSIGSHAGETESFYNILRILGRIILRISVCEYSSWNLKKLMYIRSIIKSTVSMKDWMDRINFLFKGLRKRILIHYGKLDMNVNWRSSIFGCVLVLVKLTSLEINGMKDNNLNELIINFQL